MKQLPNGNKVNLVTISKTTMIPLRGDRFVCEIYECYEELAGHSTVQFFEDKGKYLGKIGSRPFTSTLTGKERIDAYEAQRQAQEDEVRQLITEGVDLSSYDEQYLLWDGCKLLTWRDLTDEEKLARTNGGAL